MDKQIEDIIQEKLEMVILGMVDNWIMVKHFQVYDQQNDTMDYEKKVIRI